MNINARIKQLLKERKLNMTELANYCGVSPQAVKQWVDEGGTSPRGKRLKKIADFFQIPEIELVYGEPPHPDQKTLTEWGGIDNIDELTIALSDASKHASPQSQITISQLIELANQNALTDDDWRLIQQLANKIHRL